MTVVKDEAPYILEWLAFQRLVGFDEVLILANDCTDGTFEILDALAASHLCHVIKFTARDYDMPPQVAGYALAEQHVLLSEPCLLLVSDIDEFLQINVGDGTLDALLEAAPAFDVMFVRWRVFGSGGALTYSAEPVTQRFTQASPTCYRGKRFSWPDLSEVDEETEGDHIFDRFMSLRWTRSYKTLFRYAPGDRLSVHVPRISDPAVSRVDSGGRADPKQFYSYLRFYGEHTFEGSYGFCQLNHYCNRSVDEYLAKIVRGDGANLVDPRGLDHWKKGECNEVEAADMLKWKDALHDEMAQISSAAGITDLCSEVAAERQSWITRQTGDDRAIRDLRAQLTSLAGVRFPRSISLD